MKKRICIIGSGASGLTAIKCCLDEDLDPVCFERNHDIGGLWRYEKDEKQGATVYRSTIINTSKEMMCFADYPIPIDFANYMHNVKIMEYFRLYAEEFNLLKHIRFSTEVLSCDLAENYDETGQWRVKTRNRETNIEKSEIYDGVLVCIGHHANPHYPLHEFPGVDNFKGVKTHSHSYREPTGYEGKKVVVIGIGNSGGDISVELSKYAKQVYLSTRRGAWVFKRVAANGFPIDLSASRFSVFVRQTLPWNLVNTMYERQLSENFDHAMYSLKPKHRVLSQHPTVNDALPNAIISGGVIVKGNVKEFTESGVVFEDGSYEDVDVVIFATGYTYSYPFLDDSLLKVNKNHSRLYKLMWPPKLNHGTLAIIGGIQPLGAINPISEIQCRWATLVFKGKLNLPSKAEMEEQIDQRMAKSMFYKSPRHTIQVDYVTFMDDIAVEIGAKPDLLEFFKTDPKLAWKLLFGPCTPYQYRLTGPGQWPLARHHIMTLDDRVRHPFATRKVASSEPSINWMMIVLVSFLMLIVLRFIF